MNRIPNPFQPFVGASAFTHKAGLHASAMAKVQESYQHVAPELVGNTKHILVSELAGRSNVVQKLEGLGIPASDEVVRNALTVIKEQENRGFQYEGADASFEMLVRRALPDYKAPFDLVDFMVIVEKHRRLADVATENVACEATVKVQVDGEIIHTAAGGNGPSERDGRRGPQGAAGVLPGTGGRPAGGLQGARGGPGGWHRRYGPRARGVH